MDDESDIKIDIEADHSELGDPQKIYSVNVIQDEALDDIQ